MSKPKRIRNQNYNTEDILKLIEMVTDYRDVLENKKTDAITSTQKVRAWESIARLFNSQTTTYRNAEQLRQKYDSVKKEARKYAAKKRQYRLQTGGGPADAIKTNMLFEKVLEMIKLSAEGHDSIYDSDATFMASELNSGFVLEEIISVDEPIEVTLESASEAVTAINIANVHDDTGPEVETNHTGEGQLWSKYTPQMLKSPLHPALQAKKCASVEQESISSDNGMQNISLLSSHEECSFTNIFETPNHARERDIKLKRPKPSIKNKASSLSSSGRKLEPWVMMKTELARESLNYQRAKQEEEKKYGKELQELQKREVELRIQYLKRKEEEEQRREEELHDLRKEELKLSIEIKQETLKKIKTS